MVSRFANMIGVMNASIKTGAVSCEVPTNLLCIRVLQLFREHSLIYGFTYVSPYPSKFFLYPRVKILFKHGSGINGIRALNIYKHRCSGTDYTRNPLLGILSQHLIVTSPAGIKMTTLLELYLQENHKTKKYKILLEVFT
jgi:hypothetical protein